MTNLLIKMKKITLFLMLILFFFPCTSGFLFAQDIEKTAPAPLFRDPIYDGAADPVVIWNKQEKNWWMFYTCRRANVPTQDVSAYYGTKIGVACSDDNGRNWYFRAYLDLEFEKGWNTFWAPDIVYHKGKYHLFVTYIKGVNSHWSGKPGIVTFESKNLWDWKFKGKLKLTAGNIIDPTLIKKTDGSYRMFYKDGAMRVSDSKDLKHWVNLTEPAINSSEQEGAKVFRYKDYYWLLTDEWHGMRVYRSEDLTNWEKQGLILDKPGIREDDTPTGAHGDVVVLGDKAYIIYFTHPGRKLHGQTIDGQSFHQNHRTAIQAAPLKFEQGTLTADRDTPFDLFLPNQNW